MSWGRVAGLVVAGVAGITTVVGSYYTGRKAGKNAGHQQGHQQGCEQGRRESEAIYAEKLKQLSLQMSHMTADIAKRDDFIITAYALGLCSASVNGKVSSEKIETLDYLIAGIGSREKLSKYANAEISKMIVTPPNLNTVWALIEQHNFNDEKHLKLFTDIVFVIANDAHQRTSNEAEFFSAWHHLVACA